MTVKEAASAENKRVYISGIPFPTLPSITGECICRGYLKQMVYNPHIGAEKRVHMILVMKDPHGLASSGAWIEIDKAELIKETS
ncbi:MAG: hypothetical protein ACI4DP_03360 [Candidatus Ornithomonoglobus sp.]